MKTVKVERGWFGEVRSIRISRKLARKPVKVVNRTLATDVRDDVRTLAGRFVALCNWLTKL